MTPKEMAEKIYRDSYKRWCYELSHEKNVLTAKNMTEYMCDLILKNGMLYEEQFDTGKPEHHRSFWEEVKNQIHKIKH